MVSARTQRIRGAKFEEEEQERSAWLLKVMKT
jgi:hypothetical protein